MFSLFRIIGLIVLLLSPQLAGAQTVEAEGRAAIVGNDLASARRAAIHDATEQAALQAAAYVSVTQQVNDGIMEVDNLHMASAGKVGNVKLLSEQRQGQWLLVRIRADIDTQQGCDDGSGNRYRNRLAVTAFPLLHPEQASLGGLGGITTELPALLAAQLSQDSRLRTLNASTLSLIADPRTAPSQQQDDRSLTNVLRQGEQLGAQYLVSGVIRDLSMQTPRVHTEQNLVRHWYDRLRTGDDRYQRTLSLDLYVQDALTGALIAWRQYQTHGLWNLPQQQTTGFATAAFWQQDYGKQTQALLHRVGKEIGDTLACEPFRSRITRVDGQRIWFEGGQDAGIASGDRLSLFRQDDRDGVQLINSRRTLLVDRVQARSSSGTLSGDGAQLNIQRGDIVVAQ